MCKYRYIAELIFNFFVTMKKTLVAMVLLLSCCSAFAWGPWGHGTTCAVAERAVKPSTKKAVEHYLGRGIAFYGVWTDEYRSDPRYEYTSHHSVAVDENFNYIPATDYQDCIQTIEQACALIRDRKNQTDSTIAVQLKLLIHLVGDIHCPGHLKYTDVNTAFKVIPYKGEKNKVSYHSVWDEEIIVRRHCGLSARDMAYDLDRLSKKEIKAVQQGTPVDWAIQSAHETKCIYDMAHPNDELFKEFYNPAWIIVQRQLTLGGYRLAGLLDELFK